MVITAKVKSKAIHMHSMKCPCGTRSKIRFSFETRQNVKQFRFQPPRTSHAQITELGYVVNIESVIERWFSEHRDIKPLNLYNNGLFRCTSDAHNNQ